MLSITSRELDDCAEGLLSRDSSRQKSEFSQIIYYPSLINAFLVFECRACHSAHTSLYVITLRHRHEPIHFMPILLSSTLYHVWSCESCKEYTLPITPENVIRMNRIEPILWPEAYIIVKSI